MKKVLIGFLISVTMLSFIGCSKTTTTAPAPDKTIRIGIMPDVESIPFIIAERNGYYKKEGVQVKIEHFNSAKDRDSALQGGKLDGVVSDMLAVVFANEGGIGLKIVSKNDGNISLMAGKDSGINSMKDLKGRSVGLSTNTIMEYTTDRMLETAQYKPEDIKKIGIPQLPTRLEMLQGGRVDAAILPEPLSGLAVKNGARVLHTTDQLASKCGVIAFTTRSLQESPEEIKAVLRAYNDAVAYLQTESVASFAEFVVQEQGFPAQVKESLKLPSYSRAELPSEKTFNDVVQWMKGKDLIKGNYEYRALVDDRVLR
ncbi:MAG: ABC transporter substrate-binding protein [Firmicutes bacterium]|nr:ABC transporter substrate-binding protein [Bacillota bacterium]